MVSLLCNHNLFVESLPKKKLHLHCEKKKNEMTPQCFKEWGGGLGGLTWGCDWNQNQVISFKSKREKGIRLDKQSKYDDVEEVCHFYQSVKTVIFQLLFLFLADGNFIWHLFDMSQSSFSLFEPQFWASNNDCALLSLLYLLWSCWNIAVIMREAVASYLQAVYLLILGKLVSPSFWEGQATGVAGTSLAHSQADVASVA